MYVCEEGNKYQDGALVINNPTAVAVHECKRIWPGRAFDCVVSLGTGEAPPKLQTGGFKDTLLSVVESCCSVDRVDEILRVCPKSHKQCESIDTVLSDRYALLSIALCACAGVPRSRHVL
jgi:hypothetical protein